MQICDKFVCKTLSGPFSQFNMMRKRQLERIVQKKMCIITRKIRKIRFFFLRSHRNIDFTISSSFENDFPHPYIITIYICYAIEYYYIRSTSEMHYDGKYWKRRLLFFFTRNILVVLLMIRTYTHILYLCTINGKRNSIYCKKILAKFKFAIICKNLQNMFR